jgi:hypothetical protein
MKDSEVKTIGVRYEGLTLEETNLIYYYSQLTPELKMKVWDVFKEAQLIESCQGL